MIPLSSPTNGAANAMGINPPALPRADGESEEERDDDPAQVQRDRRRHERLLVGPRDGADVHVRVERHERYEVHGDDHLRRPPLPGGEDRQPGRVREEGNREPLPHVKPEDLSLGLRPSTGIFPTSVVTGVPVRDFHVFSLSSIYYLLIFPIFPSFFIFFPPMF